MLEGVCVSFLGDLPDQFVEFDYLLDDRIWSREMFAKSLELCFGFIGVFRSRLHVISTFDFLGFSALQKCTDMEVLMT